MRLFSSLVILASILGHFSAAEKIVFCYHGTWTAYAEGQARFVVEDIDTHLCTHVGYSFFGVNGDTGNILSLDLHLDYDQNGGLGNVRRFNDLKKINPNLKTMLVVGGGGEGSTKYSQVARDAGKRRTFINDAVYVMQTYGFDGLDFDWEYPVYNSGEASDKQNYITFLREMKEEFRKYNFLLTAAVPAEKTIATAAYDIPAMSQLLDYINLMAYDLHGVWDKKTCNQAPLYNDVASTDNLITWWLNQGAPAEKLVLGVPFYGHSFTLANQNQRGVGAPITGEGRGGPLVNSAGSLGYREICLNLRDSGWIKEYDANQQMPYSYQGDQWVGHEDPTSLQKKSQIVVNRNLAGIMVWSIENDDYLEACREGKNPLLNAISRGLGRI